jgi:hypothetical protein
MGKWMGNNFGRTSFASAERSPRGSAASIGPRRMVSREDARRTVLLKRHPAVITSVGHGGADEPATRESTLGRRGSALECENFVIGAHVAGRKFHWTRERRAARKIAGYTRVLQLPSRRLSRLLRRTLGKWPRVAWSGSIEPAGIGMQVDDW